MLGVAVFLRPQAMNSSSELAYKLAWSAHVKMLQANLIMHPLWPVALLVSKQSLCNGLEHSFIRSICIFQVHSL